MIKVGKVKLIVVGAIAVVILMLIGAIPSLDILDDIDTQGAGFIYNGIEGGSDENGGGDLLTYANYVTSWKADGESEVIPFQGHYRFTYDFPTASVSQVWYVVTIAGSGDPDVTINGVETHKWTSPKYIVPPAVSLTHLWVPAEAEEVVIGGVFSGTMLVEFWVHHYWLGLDWDLTKEADDLIALDTCILRSGIGSVKVQNDVVEVGDYMNMFVETGWATSSQGVLDGWTLAIYNPSGSRVFSQVVADDFAGTISWKVPDGAYSPSWDNVYLILLRNQLLDQDDDWAFTVGAGMLDDIPELPEFELVEGDEPFEKGERISIKLTSERTTFDVEGYWVWVSQETSASTTTNYILLKKWYPAIETSDGEYSATVTFVLPDAGYFRLEASAMDVMSLNSGIAEFEIRSWPDSFTDDFQDLGQSNWLAFVLAGIIGVAGFVIYRKKMLSYPLNWIVLSIMGIVAIVIVVVWGLG